MAPVRVFAPMVIAAAMALAALPVLAQSAPPAKVKREKVDVRAMVPGPKASDAASDAASDVRSSTGLTRDQRKEATLQARQDGTLQPAGDTAEPREAKPHPLVAGKDEPRSVPVAGAPPQPSGDVDLANTNEAATLATAAPPSSTKKSTRRKARSAAGAAPA